MSDFLILGFKNFIYSILLRYIYIFGRVLYIYVLFLISHYAFDSQKKKKKKKKVVMHLITIILGHNWRQLMPMLVIFFWGKHHLSPYIFESWWIYSQHFSSSQFGPYYFQLTVNLISTVNTRTKNVYVADRVYSWHT